MLLNLLCWRCGSTVELIDAKLVESSITSAYFTWWRSIRRWAVGHDAGSPLPGRSTFIQVTSLSYLYYY